MTFFSLREKHPGDTGLIRRKLLFYFLSIYAYLHFRYFIFFISDNHKQTRFWGEGAKCFINVYFYMLPPIISVFVFLKLNVAWIIVR